MIFFYIHWLHTLIPYNSHAVLQTCKCKCLVIIFISIPRSRNFAVGKNERLIGCSVPCPHSYSNLHLDSMRWTGTSVMISVMTCVTTFSCQGSKQKFRFMYSGRMLWCALLSLTNQQHHFSLLLRTVTMGDDLRTALAILAAEKSWKQFKLSWKSHGILLSDFCGNPVIVYWKRHWILWRTPSASPERNLSLWRMIELVSWRCCRIKYTSFSIVT